MIAYLELLAADIAEGIAEAFYLDDTLCEPSRITPTAGEPAAPGGEDCTAIWVWLDRIEDENEVNPDTCITQARAFLSYRIDVCYQTTAEDETDAIHLAAAECLYGLEDAIWCHLVALKDAGTLMQLGTCEHVNLTPLTTGPRQGGTVSATGGVSFQYDCG